MQADKIEYTVALILNKLLSIRSIKNKEHNILILPSLISSSMLSLSSDLLK